jgi:hypothetical protein
VKPSTTLVTDIPRVIGKKYKRERGSVFLATYHTTSFYRPKADHYVILSIFQAMISITSIYFSP